MKLYSIPYYIDLEGKVFNGVKLTPAHVKLFGTVILHDRMGNGCFADTDTLANEIKVTEGTLRNLRSELIKAGLLIAERRKDTNEIESMTVPDVVFTNIINNRGMSLNDDIVLTSNREMSLNDDIDVIKKCTPLSLNDDIDNREATPVLNKNINKNINVSSSADADSDVIKKGIELPFDEDVSVVNVKAIDDKKKETRRAAAIANKVADVLGRDKRQVTDVVVKNMRGVLTEYSEEEVLHMANWCKTQEFWRDKTLAQMIKKDTVAQALMNKKVENKYVW